MSFLILYYKDDPVAKGVLRALDLKRIEDLADVMELPYMPIYLEKSFQDYDNVIVLSIHDSSSGKPSLTVHSTGNFTEKTPLGGSKLSLSKANAWLNGNLLRNVYKYAVALGIDKDFEICFEATHHGPTIDNAVTFLEIGSTMDQWTNELAHEVLAQALEETLENYDNYPKGHTYMAIGGPHYAPKFTKLCLEEGLNIGHIMPKYVMPDAPIEMIDKAFERTINCKKILIEWKAVLSPYKQYIKEKYEYQKV